MHVAKSTAQLISNKVVPLDPERVLEDHAAQVVIVAVAGRALADDVAVPHEATDEGDADGPGHDSQVVVRPRHRWSRAVTNPRPSAGTRASRSGADCGLVHLDDRDAGGLEVQDLVPQGKRGLPASASPNNAGGFTHREP